MTNIRASIPDYQNEILNNQQFIDFMQSKTSITHYVFPQVFKTNISNLNRYLSSEMGNNYKIYYACKASANEALLKVALESGVGVDVASLQELDLCISLGFDPRNIIVGGIKSPNYLYYAIEKGCIISVYTESEWMLLDNYARGNKKNISILLRVSNIPLYDREYITKESKFGINFKKVKEIIKTIDKLYIDLLGFHHHSEERDPNLKANECIGLLNLFEDCYRAGLEPAIINIGGGLRSYDSKEANEISDYFKKVEYNVAYVKSSDTDDIKSNWRGYTHGIYKSVKGSLTGRQQARAKFIQVGYESYLESILEYDYLGKSIRKHFNDRGISLWLEPGYLLNDKVGVSCAPIIGYSTYDNGTLLYVNANMYNLSLQMRELLLDPIVYHNNDNKNLILDENFYIGGNICREEDMIMKRLWSYKGDIAINDLICFRNTAGYAQGFEDASPHLLPRGKSYAVNYNGGNINIF